ncbi:restriction endonuclease [uncultured Amnibacterium sp.]|uniref:restriction endonuclease n=1 Tax=uncultured Amnibacterium sp. TaxID=1631851 RepID=UPI0035CB70A7
MAQQQSTQARDIHLGLGSAVGFIAVLLVGFLTYYRTLDISQLHVSGDALQAAWVLAALIAVVGLALDIVRGVRQRKAAIERERAWHTQVPGEPVLTWQAAEWMAARHMRAYGFSDARVTQVGADGGIDVISQWGAAQVKFYANPIGRPDVQKLRGAAHGAQRALFYALSGFTPSAVQFADEAQVSLWQFDQRGMVWAVNSWAKAYKKPEQATT